MATTYTLIASSTPTTGASITFSSIPSTYTDLVILCSVRTDRANNVDVLTYQLNGDTGSNYSATLLQGTGSSAISSNNSNVSSGNRDALVDGGNSTASTFASGELYFPNYTSSANKQNSNIFAQENNASGANITLNSSLWRGTTAINSIKLQVAGGFYVTGTSFYLYGIKNS